MGSGQILRSWRTLLEAGSVAAMTDAMLLERFATRRDQAGETAFAALVARHGPMVQRVCRRLLRDPHDADDAFQATFLVLARKARSIRRPERLASWLYGTAYRTARKFTVQSALRRRHEAGAAQPEPVAAADLGRLEAVEIVLAELARLPDACRRMGLALACQLKAEADMAESLAARGSDPNRRPELAMWAPSYIEGLRRADTHAIRREAEAILERVKAEFGDVKHLYGMVLQNETLATVADRELADIRTLGIGQVAPEISGEDADGKPMKLSEFRGKVVVLDFGSHTHCGGCKLVYPRLRALVERYRNRPFVVLGINNNDPRDALKQLRALGEITWRCWWDGDRSDGPGPIRSQRAGMSAATRHSLCSITISLSVSRT
jgi:RNA polymerase sigma factor (sigma-70 family)